MNSPVAWALVFHIVGFVFWMGGLLTATQVLAAQIGEPSPEARQALARLEMKLLKGIAHPGAAITIIAGIVVLALQPDYLTQGWLHAKLTLVLILIVLDIVLFIRIKNFHAGKIEIKRSESKIMHGVISLVFLGILVLVMIKPF